MFQLAPVTPDQTMLGLLSAVLLLLQMCMLHNDRPIFHVQILFNLVVAQIFSSSVSTSLSNKPL